MDGWINVWNIYLFQTLYGLFCPGGFLFLGVGGELIYNGMSQCETKVLLTLYLIQLNQLLAHCTKS